MSDEFPVKPWDPPGLAPRTESQRCANHSSCAYRDDDPNRCPHCHRLWTQPSIGCRDSFENQHGRRLHPKQPQPPKKKR